MNKDALLATAIGFVIGLCITGLLLAGPSLAKYIPAFKMPVVNTKPAVTNKPAPTDKPKAHAFGVTSPLDESIEKNSDILVSGTAIPGATIVIVGNTNDAVAKASKDGTFAGKIILSEGRNIISVTQYLDGKPVSKELTVYHTEESI